MRDQMTPNERLKAIAAGRPYDRIPHAFSELVWDAAARVNGTTISEFHLEPKKQVVSTVAFYRKYGLDSVCTFIGVSALFGATITYPGDTTPYLSGHVKLTQAEFEKSYLDSPESDPFLSGFWETLDGLYKEAGDEAPVKVMFEGPITAAARILGTDVLLKSLIKDPEYTHAVLAKVTETQLKIVNALSGYEIGFGLLDPISSGNMLSRSRYMEFSHTYIKRLFAAMTEASGKKPMLHICGKTANILEDIADTGAGVFSIDNEMDISLVKDTIGHDLTVMGNIRPSESMLLGSPADVAADLKSCLRRAWDTPAGYLPSFGCGLPIDTPQENIEALFGAYRKYAKYPIDPEILI
ncbi:MAG: uroporphyrinogen decarboxylase family protein [Clostridiales Family XIII bacterium]|jgi:uroporphyrinogen decarboxylase|nr:uroporphyrinogen decarboxylase family protein [Clostridiales Family XIII bacterium]